MEPIGVQDPLGNKSEPASGGTECTETAAERKIEEITPNDECSSDKVDPENVEAEEMASDVGPKSSEAEIVSVDDKNVTGLETAEERADEMDKESGEREPARPAHDSVASQGTADISCPQIETRSEPTELFSREELSGECVEIDEMLSSREEKVEDGENDIKEENSKNSKQSELDESTLVAQKNTEHPTTLTASAGEEIDLNIEEDMRSDKERFCDCLRSLKDLASPDVLRDLASEEIFEAHHNLTEIMSVVVQALRGRWQSPRSKK